MVTFIELITFKHDTKKRTYFDGILYILIQIAVWKIIFDCWLHKSKTGKMSIYKIRQTLLYLSLWNITLMQFHEFKMTRVTNLALSNEPPLVSKSYNIQLSYICLYSYMYIFCGYFVLPKKQELYFKLKSERNVTILSK